MTQNISVLLVDDHALVRRGFRRLLEDDPSITVVGEASDGEEAIQLAGLLHPRVIVMDSVMPGMSGVAAARKIGEQWPEIAILMLSMHGEVSLVRQAFQAGARGYLLKDVLDVDLAEAVKRVATSSATLDPTLGHALSSEGSPAHGLSARQLEVLQLICNGLANPAIAQRLGISVNTVGAHRAGIMKTLRVHRAAELVAYAIRYRLVDVL